MGSAESIPTHPEPKLPLLEEDSLNADRPLNADIAATGQVQAAAPAHVSGLRVELRASNVSYTLRVRTGPFAHKTRQILHGISATFAPGSLTALMGPSGAGKTSLLTLLRSGRCSSGAIRLNGRPYSSAARHLIRTIPQDDILLAGLSAKEALYYAARLSMPRSLSHEEMHKRVEVVLAMLHFNADDAATKIGSVETRGLSGGQRKRVSNWIRVTSHAVTLRHAPSRSGALRRSGTLRHAPARSVPQARLD